MKKHTLFLSAVLILGVVITSLLFLCPASSSPWSHQLKNIIQNTLPSVVLIASPAWTLGAGSIIDAQKGMILTGKHFLHAGDTYTVRTETGESYRVEKIIPHPMHDIAILQINPDDVFRSHRSLPIVDSQAFLERGDDVLSFGALPINSAIIFSRGIISDTHQALQLDISQKSDYFIQTDINAQAGFSGGPLFDERGQIIGVNTAVFGVNTSVSWSTPVTARDVQGLSSEL